MSKDYRVNTFGLTDEENTLVEESHPDGRDRHRL